MTREQAMIESLRGTAGQALTWRHGFDAGWDASNVDHAALLEQWNDIVRASGSRTRGGAVGVVAGMRADLERMIAEREAICTWKEEEEGLYWATDCGEAFAIIEGSPDENGLRYCCFCGNRLAEAK